MYQFRFIHCDKYFIRQQVYDRGTGNATYGGTTSCNLSVNLKLFYSKNLVLKPLQIILWPQSAIRGSDYFLRTATN